MSFISRRALCDHREILTAIRAGEATQAADGMLRHLVSTTDNLMKNPPEKPL